MAADTFNSVLKALDLGLNEIRKFATARGVELDFLDPVLGKVQESLRPALGRKDRMLMARDGSRPKAMCFIDAMLDSWMELRGDRAFKDDPSIRCGLGTLGERSIVWIGQDKGTGTKGRIAANFGMPHPEGYRKAARAMRLAQRFNMPILTLIDTPGAYPGLEAEERGQACAIAENLELMATLDVPIVSFVIGEGGSGGALGIGMGNYVHMLENSMYSVISPEGCASILWADQGKVDEAVEALRFTASDLLDLGIVDSSISEGRGLPDSLDEVAAAMRASFLSNIESPSESCAVLHRANKYRRMSFHGQRSA